MTERGQSLAHDGDSARTARLVAQIESLEQLLRIQESTAIDQARLLEGAVDQLTAYSEQLQTVGRISRALSAELDQKKLLQTITDAATEMSEAAFGAFFYNVTNSSGETHLLYTLSGAPLDKFNASPIPRSTVLFTPNFPGGNPLRIDDVRGDPQYEKQQPFHGMPAAELAIASYMAIPVFSRRGDLIGGLFFGHPEPARFTAEHEHAVVDIAAQAAIAVDNARLYAEVQQGREAAERNEKRYKSIVFANPTRQAVGLANTAGDLIEDSPSWRTITGQTYEDMRGRGWLAAVHPLDRKRVAEAWDRAIATGTVFEDEYRLRTENDAYRWFHGKGVPVYGANANIAEWIGTTTDIHDKRVATESMKFLDQANKLLTVSLDLETTLRNLARIAVPAIADWCLVDLVEGESYRRVAVAHSDPAKVKLGYDLQTRFPPDEAHDPILGVIHTGQAQLVTKVTEEMLQQVTRNEEHLQVIRELGLRSWMIIPLWSRNKIAGAFTLVTADSERAFSEIELAQAEELARRAGLAIENARLYGAAQEANRAKDTFLATLSHELRTPMTAILGWSRMLSLGLNDEEMQEATQAIQQSAQAQAHIIEDILDVSRVITGKLHIESQPVKMREIASNAIAAVRPAAAARLITLEETYAGDGLVLGDAGRLRQILWNLLSNAIKFTDRRGSVTLAVEHHGSVVRVEVRDTGKGIDPNFLPYMFEPFRQAEASTTREHGGLGLGLAIVRYLVELHGGRVTAASEGEGRGSSFTLELPLYEGDTWVTADGSMRGDEEPSPAAPFPQLPGVLVLVVDDQPFTRDFVRAAMRHCGATTTTTASVKEAIEALHHERPNVVLCDIAMPGQDGFALLSYMKGDASLATIPIIAITAFGRPEDRERVLEAGFSAYVKKPVEPADLAAAVVKVLA